MRSITSFSPIGTAFKFIAFIRASLPGFFVDLQECGGVLVEDLALLSFLFNFIRFSFYLI